MTDKPGMSTRGLGLLVALVVAPGVVVAQTPPPQGEAPPVLSWTSDRVTISTGDLVTILIDEYTVAAANRDETNTRERGRDVSIGGSIAGFSARTNNDVSSRTRGASARRETFTAEITARVVEMLPGGMARIEGSKAVQIDDHEQAVTVRGIIRTQDISVANTVDSWRIADAEILYDSNDELGKTGGIWSRLLDLIIP